MDIFESDLKITHGAVVLVDFGYYFQEQGIQIVPSHEVQVEGFVAGDSIKTFDRGNYSNQINFTVWTDCGNVEAAKAFQLAQTMALKTAGGGVSTTIQLQYHTGTITLPNSNIVACPSTTYQRFCRFSYTILGGALSGSLLDNRLITEGGDVMVTEGGDVMVTEAAA